ncbi:hypothetical protein CS8_063680 [Cupriavidus sp. 8B]
MPALRLALTSSGPETRNMGAPMTGKRALAKTFRTAACEEPGDALGDVFGDALGAFIFSVPACLRMSG